MSVEESWYAGFDVIDLSTTPISEMPEQAGFHLICPIDGCDMEERFDYLPEIADSEWTEMSIKDQILTDGFTLKEAYCPGWTRRSTGRSRGEYEERRDRSGAESLRRRPSE